MISKLANVFESAKIGDRVKIGAFAEIGRIVNGDKKNLP